MPSTIDTIVLYQTSCKRLAVSRSVACEERDASGGWLSRAFSSMRSREIGYVEDSSRLAEKPGARQLNIECKAERAP